MQIAHKITNEYILTIQSRQLISFCRQHYCAESNGPAAPALPIKSLSLWKTTIDRDGKLRQHPATITKST